MFRNRFRFVRKKVTYIPSVDILAEATASVAGASSLAVAALIRAMSVLLSPPTIAVDGPVALADAPVVIELHGFPSERTVTVTVTQSFASGSRWQAHATFIADQYGRVALARDAPIGGMYSGVAAMGLFWSAKRMPGEVRSAPAGSIIHPGAVDLEPSMRTDRVADDGGVSPNRRQPAQVN